MKSGRCIATKTICSGPSSSGFYEEWDAEREQWHLKRIEFIFEDPELPLPSENPAVAVEQRHGWLIPPEWEFQSEVWAYERKRVQEDRV